mgnify:CR=1 FL=1
MCHTVGVHDEELSQERGETDGMTETKSAPTNWKQNTVLFLSGQIISLFGSMLVQYAIMWHITLVTKSGVMMMISIICGFLPTFLFSPFAGVWADRYNRKLLIARPIVPMGNDIGYLPGEKDEKLRPWMQPIYDNLEFLFDAKKPGDLDRILMGLGSIQVEALTYIRGRSIPGQFIIIDEAQNLSRHEVKTIVTRVGEGSKIVLIGDPEQIDHPYLDSVSNGLTNIVESFKEESISGHVTLEKGERSKLAQLAAEKL